MTISGGKKILVTLGEAGGIGPEIICKAWSKLPAATKEQSLVLGESWILKEAAGKLETNFEIQNTLNQLLEHTESLGFLSKGDIHNGRFTMKSGEASYGYFQEAIGRCQKKLASAIVTAPLCKEALHGAGHFFFGHTDILEKELDTPVVMTIFHPKLVVSHVTDHMPLRQALDAITPQRLEFVIRETHQALIRMRGIEQPRIALAGINPHAGENGVLGREEIEVLQPLMGNLSQAGMKLFGPLPGDTIFYSALKGAYDGVIAMYHDQGFGPMKTLDMAHGVNCTLGLPFVRTSPDHGTAFDIAGKGLADETSMLEAWNLAANWANKNL